ncbi:hypothetical protein [Sinosporangium siamense]|uniref:Uncharacterized protein n=1 Tax=Sinosporangium siamense TaxID=1367973 RepID=A0A919RJE6_9ACTN|nr:hypothetical protein [Sinosporangium siamense]GII94733.1 hypothetical protein Ssi02_49640 [Sinosporangium siamense]
MALAWHPVNTPLADLMGTLARSLWDAASLSTVLPDAGQLTPVHSAGWEIDVFHDKADAVSGFSARFGLYYEPDDEDDPDLDDFPQHLPSPQWHVDHSATRQQFDVLFEAGRAAMAARLGEPEAAGMFDEDDDWRYAVWRVGDRLIAVAQAEDFASHSLYTEASIRVVDFPATSKVPTADEMYDILVNQVS